MLPKPFIILFISMHIGFIFMQIYKQSSLVALSYEQQQLEAIQQEFIHKKNTLTTRLMQAQHYESIARYASTELGMKKISLQQFKHLPDENTAKN